MILMPGYFKSKGARSSKTSEAAYEFVLTFSELKTVDLRRRKIVARLNSLTSGPF